MATSTKIKSATLGLAAMALTACEVPSEVASYLGVEASELRSEAQATTQSASLAV